MRKKYLTTTQVAEIFGVTNRTVVRWENEGLISCLKIGNTRRFSRNDIRTFRNTYRRDKEIYHIVENDYLTAEEVAIYFGVSFTTVEEWIGLDLIGSMKIGEARRFTLNDVRAFENAFRKKAGS